MPGFNDPVVIATIVAPIVGAVVGIAVDRALARRPKLQTHWGHVSSHRIPMESGQPALIVNTSSVVVRNAGRATAHQVRVTHSTLTGINFQVYPVIDYAVENLPDGGAQIVFPELIPDAQVSIQYVGIGVRTDNIMGSCSSSEGSAAHVEMEPTRVYPDTVRRVVGGLLLIGAAVSIYAIVRAMLWLWPKLAALVPEL